MNFKTGLTDKQIKLAINEFYKYTLMFESDLINHRDEKVTIKRSTFDEVFGLAYVSSSSYALITLDTNEHVRIKQGTYIFSHLCVSDEGCTILALENSEGISRYEKISNLNLNEANK